MKWPQDSCGDRKRNIFTVKNWPQCKTRSRVCRCAAPSFLPLSSLAIACLSSPTSWTHTSLPQPDQERLCHPPDSMTSRHAQIMHRTNLISSRPFQYMDNSNGPNPVWYDDWYSSWYGNRCIILFQSLLTMWGSHHQKYPLTLLLVCKSETVRDSALMLKHKTFWVFPTGERWPPSPPALCAWAPI